MSWGYSDLSHKAKLAGGPEKFIQDIENFNYNKGFKIGKKEQLIFDSLIAGGLFCCYKLYKTIRKRIHESEEYEITEEQAEYAKNSLIQELEEENILEQQLDA